MIKKQVIIFLIFIISTSAISKTAGERNNKNYEKVKFLFEQSLNTKDDEVKKSLREKIINLSPDSEYGLFAKGYLLNLQGKSLEALEFYTKAIQLKPDFAYSYHNRGIINSQFKDYKEALKDFNRAIELQSDFALAYYQRGLVKGFLQNFDEAIKDFDKAIKLKPDFEAAYIVRAKFKNYIQNSSENKTIKSNRASKIILDGYPINGTLVGDVRISHDTALQGVISGKVTVSENIIFDLNGMLNGDLILEKGSVVNINGMVEGDVFNKGGNLKVFGQVVGNIVTDSGVTFIDPQANVSTK